MTFVEANNSASGAMATETRLFADPTDKVPAIMGEVQALLEAEHYTWASDRLLTFALAAIDSRDYGAVNRLTRALAIQVPRSNAYRNSSGQAQILNILGITLSIRSDVPERAALRSALEAAITRSDGEHLANKILRYL